MTAEWPVAEIPTAPAPTRAGGRQIPLRWPHHGDLRVLVDVDTRQVAIAADDLVALAELDAVDAEDLHPSIRPTITWANHPGDDLLEHYTLAEAVAVLEHSPTHQTADLLEWMREQLPYVVTDEVLDAAVGLESFCTAYTVQQAAIILDRDPQVLIGRQRLFTHLEQLGWAHRSNYGTPHWAPTSVALQHQWLTVRTVTIRHGKASAPYPQLHITPAGLAELRSTLGATPTLLDPAPTDF